MNVGIFLCILSSLLIIVGHWEGTGCSERKGKGKKRENIIWSTKESCTLAKICWKSYGGKKRYLKKIMGAIMILSLISEGLCIHLYIIFYEQLAELRALKSTIAQTWKDFFFNYKIIRNIFQGKVQQEPLARVNDERKTRGKRWFFRERFQQCQGQNIQYII